MDFLDFVSLLACILQPLLFGVIFTILFLVAWIATMILFFPKDLEEWLSDAADEPR